MPPLSLTNAECELCDAVPFTEWFHDDDTCWVAVCESCATPMVVWRSHGVEPPSDALAHMMDVLRRVAAEKLGEYRIDDNMRSIPDHFHVHARPKLGFYGPFR